MFTLLEINLTNKSYNKKIISADLVSEYLGGRGLGVRLFFEYSKPDVSPTSPNAPLFFMTGVLTDANVPMTGRFHSVFKSPLTNTIFDSSCGGKAGLYLKKQGIDGIVIFGKSENPVYIYIEDGGVKFLDAKNLFSKKITEREKLLKQSHKCDISCINIGISAENGVLFANAVCDNRFFGRGGIGFVMSSKNLFSVVIKRGERPFSEPIEKQRFNYTLQELKKWLHGNPVTSQGLPEFGTSVMMNLINEMKLLPHKNFQENEFSEAEKISGEALQQKTIKRKACPKCPVACGRVTTVGEGPEYETLWALGANLGIFDLDCLIEINQFCFEYALDTISLGATIACYLEINNLRFGDKELVTSLIEKTVSCKEEGRLIALGSKKMAENFGKPELSMSVKGLELPAYHPKSVYGMALAYATSNRGGCHLRAYMIAPEILGIPKLISPKMSIGKSGLVIYLQNSHTSADSAIFCRFMGLAITDEYLSRLVAAYINPELATQDYLKIGERIYILERAFNCQNGFNINNDFLPPRLMFKEFPDMLSEYYRARGYDDNGVPTKKKLDELNLSSLL